MNWKYTDDTNRVVSRTNPDGNVESCLASVLPAGTEILPADVVLPEPVIDPIEKLRLFLDANPDVKEILK